MKRIRQTASFIRTFESSCRQRHVVDGFAFESSIERRAERIFADYANVERLVSGRSGSHRPLDELAEIREIGGFYLIFTRLGDLRVQASGAWLQQDESEDENQTRRKRETIVCKILAAGLVAFIFAT